MDDEALERLRRAVVRTREATRGRPATGLRHGEADDRAGTFATDDARSFDPFPLLAALSRAGARAVVIGQVAGILHGSAELTGRPRGRRTHRAPSCAPARRGTGERVRP